MASNDPNQPDPRDEITCNDDVIPSGLALLLGQFHGTNVEDLLTPFLRQIQDLEDALCGLFYDRVLDVATGASIDQYGSIVDESRGDLGDRDYRKFIRTKIVSIFAQGEINRITGVAKILAGANKVEYRTAYPAGYELEYETVDFLTVDGKRRLMQRIEDITPSGVGFSIIETVEDAFAFAGPEHDFGFGVGRLSGQF